MYSLAVISFYETKVLKEEPGTCEVLVYNTKEQLAEYYKNLSQTINDLILIVARAEKDLRIADMHRNYYWALVLTRGHPNNQKLRNNFGGTGEESLMPGSIERKNSIFTFLNVKITAVSSQENPPVKEFQLTFTYQNQPVQNLDYTWYEGDGCSGILSVNNGLGVAIFYGIASKNLKSLYFKVEHQYRNLAEYERDVKRMIESVEIPYFAGAEISIPVAPVKCYATTSNDEKIESTCTGVDLTEYAHCKNAVQQIIKAVQAKNP